MYGQSQGMYSRPPTGPYSPPQGPQGTPSYPGGYQGPGGFQGRPPQPGGGYGRSGGYGGYYGGGGRRRGGFGAVEYQGAPTPQGNGQHNNYGSRDRQWDWGGGYQRPGSVKGPPFSGTPAQVAQQAAAWRAAGSPQGNQRPPMVPYGGMPQYQQYTRGHQQAELYGR